MSPPSDGEINRLAQELDLSPAMVRRSLDRLIALGLIEVRGSASTGVAAQVDQPFREET